METSLRNCLAIVLFAYSRDALGAGLSGLNTFVGLGLFVALWVTTYLTTDVASVPLFWVLPLAAYLLTFILAFGRWPLVKAMTTTWLSEQYARARNMG